MAPIRQSNAERRRGRDECREKLARHIHDKLGFEIKPSEVRLNPRANDPYSWRALLGKEELLSKIFAKNLSDHSIGTYRLLCREVGRSFEAVPSNTQRSTVDSVISLSTPEPSFSFVIDKLREENAKLLQDVDELRSRADAESRQRYLVEEDNRRLHSNQQWLEGQLRDCADAVDYFKDSVARCFFGLDKVLPILEDLRKDASLHSYKPHRDTESHVRMIQHTGLRSGL
ncbi:hypothetical protein B0T17DRAFT_149373 [Bombardia bombarda]|uniref:Uncharacterized protein n=1 Tax=Bombardia bombarda TaxID=252184 RepID=A0AA39X6N2_9PEZI|nr:hypothetical protein B0T17DRAFT_149373 [Bombardia bombarda]